ncbi:hypothetical protein ACEWY4_001855 [Coilia grayii]|uniref:Uncharacterized protein n=1 Tax=Coilia grayii TaxID=363190 RepID=A0ABD1KU63_9TELE
MEGPRAPALSAEAQQQGQQSRPTATLSPEDNSGPSSWQTDSLASSWATVGALDPEEAKSLEASEALLMAEERSENHSSISDMVHLEREEDEFLEEDDQQAEEEARSLREVEMEVEVEEEEEMEEEVVVEEVEEEEEEEELQASLMSVLGTERELEEMMAEQEAQELRLDQEVWEWRQEMEAQKLRLEKEVQERRQKQETQQLRLEQEAQERHQKQEARELRWQKEAPEQRWEQEPRELRLKQEFRELRRDAPELKAPKTVEVLMSAEEPEFQEEAEEVLWPLGSTPPPAVPEPAVPAPIPIPIPIPVPTLVAPEFRPFKDVPPSPPRLDEQPLIKAHQEASQEVKEPKKELPIPSVPPVPPVEVKIESPSEPPVAPLAAEESFALKEVPVTQEPESSVPPSSAFELPTLLYGSAALVAVIGMVAYGALALSRK